MNKPSAGLPSAQGESAFGFCSRALDVQQVCFCTYGGGGQGLAVDKVFKGFLGS